MERFFAVLEVGVVALCTLVLFGAMANKACAFWEARRTPPERRTGDSPVTMACIGLGLMGAILVGLVLLWPPNFV